MYFSNNQQPLGVTIIMGLAKIFFPFASALFLDHFGRRPLLKLGSAGMVVSLAGLGLGSKFLKRSGTKPMWAIMLCVEAVCADVSVLFNRARAHHLSLLVRDIPDKAAGLGYEPGHSGEPGGEQHGGDVVFEHFERDNVWLILVPDN